MNLDPEVIAILRRVGDLTANVSSQPDYEEWGAFYSDISNCVDDIQKLFLKHRLTLRCGDRELDLAVITTHQF